MEASWFQLWDFKPKGEKNKNPTPNHNQFFPQRARTVAQESRPSAPRTSIPSPGTAIMWGHTWRKSQPTPRRPADTKSKCNGSKADGVKRCQGMVWPTQGKYPTHSVRSNLQKSLMGPSFCGSRKNRENKKKLDMVRVKWPSSSRSGSTESHASLTCFTKQHRDKNSFPFRTALKTHFYWVFRKIFFFFLQERKKSFSKSGPKEPYWTVR